MNRRTPTPVSEAALRKGDGAVETQGSSLKDHPQVPASMQAVCFDKYGDVSRLQVRSLPTPKPRYGQLLIRVHASSVNPIDIRLRSGEGRKLLRGKFPRIPGYDVAGEVVIAPKGSGFNAGDYVLALLDSIYGGASAQYAVCKFRAAHRIPVGMSFAEAAALPLAGSTALQCLRTIAKVKAGQRVLINGASGGVGAFAVQIAKAYGAEVTGIASEQNRDFVMSLGADEFIDYNQQDFTRLGRYWNIVFDVAGKSSFWATKKVVAPRGYYISTEPDIRGILTSLATWFSPKTARVVLVRPNPADLAELIRLSQTDKLKITINQAYGLEELATAHRHLEQGGVYGKLIVVVP